MKYIDEVLLIQQEVCMRVRDQNSLKEGEIPCDSSESSISGIFVLLKKWLSFSKDMLTAFPLDFYSFSSSLHISCFES